MRRVLHMLLVGCLAAFTSLALIVTTPTNAQAFVDGAKVMPIIQGGIKTAGPSLLVRGLGVATGPWGWAISGGIMLGQTLYSTRESWWPYVAGDWGDSADDVPAEGGDTAPHVRLVAGSVYIHPDNPDWIFVEAEFVDTIPTWTYYDLAAELHCKRPDGTQYTYRPAVTSAGMGDMENGNIIGIGSFRFICPSGHEPVGLRAGPPGVDGLPTVGDNTQHRSPHNVIRWGTAGGDDAFDPDADTTVYTATVECVQPDGSIVKITRDTPGGLGGVAIPSCAEEGLGDHGWSIDIDGTPEGMPKDDLWELKPETTDPEFPECAPSRPMGCQLDVKVDNEICTAASWACQNWTRIDPGRVLCQWGPYTLSDADCHILERGYEPGGPVVGTEPNTDGDPDTRSDVDINGDPLPDPYAPPIPKPNPNEWGEPVKNPDAPPGAEPVPLPNPDGSPGTQNCWAAAASFNPIEWVFVPVKCALLWAFQPTPEVVQGVTTDVVTSIKTKGPGPALDVMGDAFDDVPTGDGGTCAGPGMQFAIAGVDETIYPFSACGDVMSKVAAISKAVASMLLVVSGGLAIARGIGQAFGFNFTVANKE